MKILDALWNRVEAEPVAAAGVVRAAIVMGTAFGLAWSGTQVGEVYLFTEILFTWLSRQAATPNSPS